MQTSALEPRDARDRLIVALDVPTPGDAEILVDSLGSQVTFYKIGMQLVFAGGLISWLFGIPIYSLVTDPALLPEGKEQRSEESNSPCAAVRDRRRRRRHRS